MSVEISDETRRQVAERAYHVCEYCLVHEADLFHGCEVDHIISVKHKGRTELKNLAYACFSGATGTKAAILVRSRRTPAS